MKNTLFKTGLVALIFLGVVSCKKQQKGEFTIKLENGLTFSSLIDEAEIAAGNSSLQKVPYNNGILKFKLPATIGEDKLLRAEEAVSRMTPLNYVKISNKSAKLRLLGFVFYKDGKALKENMQVAIQTTDPTDVKLICYLYSDKDVTITDSGSAPSGVKISVNLNLKKGYNLISLCGAEKSLTIVSYASSKDLKFMLMALPNAD